MRFTTPKFWYRPTSMLATALSPFGWFYAAATAYRLRHGAHIDLCVPVICIGNLTAGGGGKTPTALALHKLLNQPGVHFLSRGHGGRLTTPTRVDTEKHTAGDVGDEPLLLAAAAPCWIARNRAAGGKAAVAAGAGLVIMDDGLQNPALKKSMNIVVVKGDMGFGNGHMIPAGPLRETVSAGLSRTHAIISIGDPTHSSLQELPANIPVFRGWYEPLAEDLAALAHKRWVSIAGIAQPDHFPDLLTRHGIEVAHPIALPDHAPISDTMAQSWFEQAQLLDAGLVATAKDWVRLPTVWRPKIRQLRIALIFEDPQGVYELISEKIALTSPPGGPDVS